MKDLYIIGAGGFGREVQWLVERINAVTPTWRIAGFIDDFITEGKMVNGVPVVGKVDWLNRVQRPVSAVCAIASPAFREKAISRIWRDNIFFPNLIDPTVVVSRSAKIGNGFIACANTVLSVGIQIGDFSIVDWNCTIGHDACLSSYVTLYPNANVSGNVRIGEATEIGTGAQIIQGKSIGNSVVIGAGAVVINDILAYCTAVGSPARPIKFNAPQKQIELITAQVIKEERVVEAFAE